MGGAPARTGFARVFVGGPLVNPVGMPPGWWALIAVDIAFNLAAVVVAGASARGGRVLKGSPRRVVASLFAVGTLAGLGALGWFLATWEVFP